MSNTAQSVLKSPTAYSFHFPYFLSLPGSCFPVIKQEAWGRSEIPEGLCTVRCSCQTFEFKMHNLTLSFQQYFIFSFRNFRSFDDFQG